MLVLNFEVLLVVLGHGFSGQPFQVLVVVYVQWHVPLLLSPLSPAG